MRFKQSFVTKISESGNEMKTNEILDHVIALQLDKIELVHNNSRVPITEATEKAMENMIKLLEIRYVNKR